MKHLYLVIAIILFGTATTTVAQDTTESNPAGTSASRERDRQEIERLEAEWNAINEVSDAEGKRRLLAEDSYHVGPSGRLYNKALDIEAARLSYKQKQASNAITKFEITDLRIRLYEGVAVVTASGRSVTTTQDGQTRRGSSFRAVHVWEKRDGRWQIVVDQVTGGSN